MGQFELGDFDGDERRSTDEAAAVAGDDPTAPDVVDAETVRYPDARDEMTITVTQVNYTVEGRGDDEYPVIHVFGRTEGRELEHVEVYDFRPYFYAPADSVDEARLAEYDRVTGYEETDAEGDPYESIRGERLVKVFGQTPRDVGQIRDDFDHFEADILFPNRFLIDKDVTSGLRVPERRDDDGTVRVPHDEVEPVEASATPRVNTFDIEVDDRRGFPEDGEEPVVCLTSHDSYRDEYVVWLYQSPAGVDGPGALGGYNPIEDDFEADVRVFEAEEAMLEAFVDYLRETDPDILTGWNFADFDAPYLLDRMETLQSPRHDHDLDVDRLSRVEEVWRSDWQGPDIKGRVVFDLLRAYRATKFTELESYRLDAVGEQELGVGKERYPGDIGDLWEEDPERLLEYNLRDVELCVELDRKQDIIAFFEELSSFVGCKLEDAPTAGDAVDMYVLHKAHGEFALPSKGTVESGEEFEGGAVFDPITGVRENVSVLDLKCFSGDTEILTPEGAVSVTELEVGDPVYTLDPDTFECVVSPVAETHEYENRFGRLHHLDGNTHDFKITPNHRFLVSATREWDEQTPEDFDFVEYRDITESRRFAFPQHEPMGGHAPESFSLVDHVEDGYVVVYYEDDLRSFRNDVPNAVTEELDLAHGSSDALGIERKVGKYLIPVESFREHREVVQRHADHLFLKYDRGHRELPLSFEMQDWLEFLGWYVTEGSTYRDDHSVTIHQSPGDGRIAIQSLLDRMGLNYSLDDRGLNLSSAYLCEWLEDNCGDGFASKRLPHWVRELDAELLEPLLDTLIRADGQRSDSGLGKFWTKSDHLKEDITQIAVRCGHKPTVSKQSDGTWYVSVGKRGSFRKSTNESIEPHDGTVHCITAEENHVVLAGRNGNFQWVGQSLYPMCMWTVNASPETKVDPEAYDGDTYRTPTGQHFRTEPPGMMREMIDELLSEREEKKALRDQREPGTPEYERYDRQQASVKVVMNSLYGVSGWDRFRLYDKDSAAAVTATGREVISYTEETVNEFGHDVIYGDSVTGDRPVVARDADGSVRIFPIEELFETATPTVEPDVAAATDGGTATAIEDPKDRRALDGWEALSLSQDGYAEWQPIEAVIRHETDKEVVKLQHKFGESTTTRDHSYVVEEADGFAESEPGDVDSPLRIPDVADVDTKTEIDVYDVLRGYTREYEDGRSVGTENAETKIKRIHADEEFVWFGHEHHRDQTKTVLVRRYVDLREQEGRALVRLLAAYVSEGSSSTVETTSSRFGASISEERRGWLERLQDDYYRLFENTTAGIVESNTSGERSIEYDTGDGTEQTTYTDGTAKLQMMNELAAVFFREFAGQTSRGKRIPSFVFHLPDDLQKLFLDVLVEGDGSREFPRYTDEYAERNFDFETTSRRLAAGLSVLLTQRGRKHSLKYRDGKGSYTVRTCDWYREGRDPVLTEVNHDGYVYDLCVHENHNFVDAVGGIVLHNTDSVMLEIGHGASKEQSIEDSFELEEQINDSYDVFASGRLDADEHRFEIEFEKLYRRFFQAGKKKRYAGHIVWKEGKEVDDIDITGFEYQRSDIAQITKEVQREVIEMIVHGEDLADVKEYVHGVIEKFREGDVSLEEVGIPGGIGKKLDAYDTDTAQVRGAKYANLLLGTNFASGSKPKRLYIETVHPEFFERIERERDLDPAEDPLYGEFKREVASGDGVICFEFADQIPEEFAVDWDKMLDKTLKGPIARVLEALDVSWQEVKSGQEQTGLGQYM